MNCEFCGATLKTRNSVLTHQKRAKYCLKIQKEKFMMKERTNGIEKIVETDTGSNNIVFDISQENGMTDETNKENNIKRLINLLKTETEKNKRLELLLKEKDQEKMNIIFDHQKQITDIYKNLSERELLCLEEIAKQPRKQITNKRHINNSTTSNTSRISNTLNNMQPLIIKEGNFTDKINESFNTNYFLSGQKGAARFAVDKLLKDKNGKLNYTCTDPSRQIFRFKTNEGGIIRDVKARKLTSAIAQDLLNKSAEIAQEGLRNCNEDIIFLYFDNTQDIKKLQDDNCDFSNELACLTSI